MRGRTRTRVRARGVWSADTVTSLSARAQRRKQKEKSQKKEAGFGAHCLGDKFNSCLVVINVRGGMLRRICVTCDDAFLFAASDGLGGWGDER